MPIPRDKTKTKISQKFKFPKLINPYLISTTVMATVESNCSIKQVSDSVQAHQTLLDRAERYVHGVRDGQFRVDVVQVPLERFALQLLPQLHSGLDAVGKKAKVVCELCIEWEMIVRHARSERNVFGERHGGIVELLEVIHPDLGGAASVACKDVATAPGERVGVLLPEDVTHPAAGDDFQAAAALPHSEGNF